MYVPALCSYLKMMRILTPGTHCACATISLKGRTPIAPNGCTPFQFIVLVNPYTKSEWCLAGA